MSYVEKYITEKRSININLNPDMWELYAYKDGQKAFFLNNVAHEINKAIETAFNNGADKKETRNAALETMNRYADYGAYDSEPMGVLEDILAHLYR